MSPPSICEMELFQVADSMANCLDPFAVPYVSVRVVFSVSSVKKVFRSEPGPQLPQQHSAACEGQTVFSLLTCRLTKLTGARISPSGAGFCQFSIE